MCKNGELCFLWGHVLDYFLTGCIFILVFFVRINKLDITCYWWTGGLFFCLPLNVARLAVSCVSSKFQHLLAIASYQRDTKWSGSSRFENFMRINLLFFLLVVDDKLGSWSECTDAHIFVSQQEASLEIYSILPSSPSPSSLKWSNIQIKTLTGKHGGLTLLGSPPLPPFHAGKPKWALSFSLPLELLAWKTTIILSDLSPPSARDQSRLCTQKTLFDARSRLVTAACDGRAVCCWCTGSLIFGVLQVFGCRNSPPLPFLLPQIPCVTGRWQLSNGPSRPVAVIEKRDGWLLV